MAKNNRELTPQDVIIAEEALMDFQFAVIKAMNEQNITQKELAEKLGISKARISQMLSPDANPTIKVVGRIIAALNMEKRYAKKQETQVEINVPREYLNRWAIEKGKVLSTVWHNDNRQKHHHFEELNAA